MNQSIMLVDQSEKQRESVQSELQKAGYKVTFGKTEKIFQDIWDADPAMILLFLNSEENLSIPLCKELKIDPRTKEIPIIVIGNPSLSKDCLEAVRLGAEDFLFHPFLFEELITRIKIRIHVSFEKVISDNTKFIQSLIHINPGIIYIYDLQEKRNIYSNDGMQKLLGYSVEEIRNFGDRLFLEIMHPEDLNSYLQNIIPLYIITKDNTPIIHEYRMRNKAGEWCWLESYEIIYNRDPKGQARQIFGTVQDVTDRKLAELALQESEERYRNMINILPDGIVIHSNGRILFANDSAARILEFSNASELIGLSPFQFIHPDYQKKALDRAKLLLKNETSGESVEYICLTFLGKEKFISLTGIPFHYMGENSILTVVSDIDELKQAQLELETHKNKLEEIVQNRTSELLRTIRKLQDTQAQLIQSEKLASLGILTAGIAHEINNPINYISSSILALKNIIEEMISILPSQNQINPRSIDSTNTDQNISEMIESVRILSDNIVKGTKRTVEIIKCLRIFSRMDTEAFSLLDISENLESTLLLLQYQCRDRIQIIRDFEKLPPIQCFPGKLSQVFMNVLVNAIQSIDSNGTITIQTRSLKSSPDFPKPCIRISIIDTGTGISPEIQNKIFEPFFTTKEIGKGTGLGLSITYGIIEEHKGKILFSSIPGKGTEFTIYLPI